PRIREAAAAARGLPADGRVVLAQQAVIYGRQKDGRDDVRLVRVSRRQAAKDVSGAHHMNVVLTPEEEIIAAVRGTMLDGRNWRKERMAQLIENEVRPEIRRVLALAHDDECSWRSICCWDLHCERCA